MKFVLGKIDQQLNTVTEFLEQSGEKVDELKETEVKVLDELSKKSKIMRSQQDGFVAEARESLDEIMKAQEGITRSLGSVGKTLSMLCLCLFILWQPFSKNIKTQFTQMENLKSRHLFVG